MHLLSVAGVDKLVSISGHDVGNVSLLSLDNALVPVIAAIHGIAQGRNGLYHILHQEPGLVECLHSLVLVEEGADRACVVCLHGKDLCSSCQDALVLNQGSSTLRENEGK